MRSLPRTLPWNLTDLAKVEKNGFNVMSTFACGGGSTMGYKRAGFDVIAANDIDPQMAEHYKRNHHPKHYYLMPVGELVKLAKARELPAELYSLDILDGSPPCSSFSMAGNREKDWGKDKHFREGQAKQVLDDLFFDYLDLVEALRPRVSIAENVKGIITGAAKGYTKEIVTRYRALGYSVQVFLIDASSCGVPQRRERVFFVASQTDKRIDIQPSDKPITVREAWQDLPGGDVVPELLTAARAPVAHVLYARTRKGESFGKASLRERGVNNSFTRVRLNDNDHAPTLTAHYGDYYHPTLPRSVSQFEFARLGAFPDDYWSVSASVHKYMVGMSVPPFMTQVVAEAVRDQWLVRNSTES